MPKTLSESHTGFLLQIVLIQACQQFENVKISLPGDIPTERFDANRGNPPENKHIVLKRPHTLLLLSSVTGGLALRGAYTEAFTQQMSKSNGQLEIEQMQSRARINMQKHHPGSSSQIPEMRSTLMKVLKLPPAKQDTLATTSQPSQAQNPSPQDPLHTSHQAQLLISNETEETRL